MWLFPFQLIFHSSSCLFFFIATEKRTNLGYTIIYTRYLYIIMIITIRGHKTNVNCNFCLLFLFFSQPIGFLISFRWRVILDIKMKKKKNRTKWKLNIIYRRLCCWCILILVGISKNTNWTLTYAKYGILCVCCCCWGVVVSGERWKSLDPCKSIILWLHYHF